MSLITQTPSDTMVAGALSQVAAWWSRTLDGIEEAGRTLQTQDQPASQNQRPYGSGRHGPGGAGVSAVPILQRMISQPATCRFDCVRAIHWS